MIITITIIPKYSVMATAKFNDELCNTLDLLKTGIMAGINEGGRYEKASGSVINDSLQVTATYEVTF